MALEPEARALQSNESRALALDGQQPNSLQGQRRTVLNASDLSVFLFFLIKNKHTLIAKRTIKLSSDKSTQEEKKSSPIIAER